MKDKLVARIKGFKYLDGNLLFLLPGLILFLIANFCGIGWTYDSNLYLEIANNGLNDGILNAEGFQIKPPVYPLVLTLIGPGGVFWLNLACLLG